MLIRSFGGAAARLVFAVFAIAAFSAVAEAALYITYVASNGNDANPCTVVTAPCKTLSRAYSVTPTNGTVRVLTALQSNLNIAKNITISGDGAPIVGTITISGASTKVTLRGLQLNGVGIIANGIRIDSAAAVHIEDSTVERYAGDGIKIITTAATKLFIVNTVSRGNLNSGDGLHIEAINARVEIKDSRFDQNGYTGAYLNVPDVSVTGSSASGNAKHGFVLGGERTKITETSADHNSGDGFAVRSDAVYLTSAETSGNGAFGLHVEPNQIAIIDHCKFLPGAAGSYAVRNEGKLYSLENNIYYSFYGFDELPWQLR
jgi:hypothetical protein